jgi:ribosome-binding protein aMBF1 (putative translation factor)
MILNERQYNVTKGWIRKFQQLVNRLQNDPAERQGVHPLLYKARLEAAQSELEVLRDQAAEYEALRSGKRDELPLDALSDLPQSLILARVARGMTQKSLAERLGMREQQIQRYEATRYAGASMKRVLEVAAQLGIAIQGKVTLETPPNPAAS